MEKLIQGQKVKCPYCGKEQSDVVEDFVVPGKIGEESTSEDECEWCYAPFAVACVAADAYEVLAI